MQIKAVSSEPILADRKNKLNSSENVISLVPGSATRHFSEVCLFKNNNVYF